MSPYAEDYNFWMTGKSSPDTWMDKAKKQIEALGGIVKAEGFICEQLPFFKKGG